MYQEYTLSRAEAQRKQMEKMLTQQNQCRELELTAMRGEITSLKKVKVVVLWPFSSCIVPCLWILAQLPVSTCMKKVTYQKCLFQMMEDYKRKYSEVSERLMERNRQYQKLQGLYDSLRLRSMVVSAGERDTLLQAGQLNFRGGKTSKLMCLCIL